MATILQQSSRAVPRRSRWLEFELIGLLADSSHCTQRSLAARLGVSLGTVNGALRRMAAADLLTFGEISGSRTRRLILTDKGRRRLAQVAPEYLSVRAAEIERAARLLTDLRAILSNRVLV